jgi:branched-chain amino acid transport system permease protein
VINGKGVLLILLGGGLALVPWFTARSHVLNLLFLIFLFSTLASSWNILSGYAGQISLGHAAFFGLGALTTRLLWLAAGQPLSLSLFAGGVVAVALALLIGAPALRLKGVYFSIGTLAMAEILRLTVSNRLPVVSALPAEHIAGYNLVPRYFLALGLMVLTLATSYLLSRSRAGLGMMAVREDEAAAQSVGINAFRHKLLALGLSAFFAGLAGSVFAYYHVSYYHALPFGPAWTFDALLITFVGGVGTLIGPVVGAIFFVLLRDVLAKTLVDIHLILFGSLFILVVLLLPGGLVEAWERILALTPKFQARYKSFNQIKSIRRTE